MNEGPGPRSRRDYEIVYFGWVDVTVQICVL